MTETLDVTQLYIKNLENKVVDLVKSTLILETNLGFINSVLEQKNGQIEELNRNNFNFNETIGNIQTNHQNEIAELRKDYENRFSQIHLDAMNEIEKLHNEKNKIYQDLQAIIQDLKSKLAIEQETSKVFEKLYNDLKDSNIMTDAMWEELRIENPNKKTKSKKSKNKKEDLSF